MLQINQETILKIIQMMRLKKNKIIFIMVNLTNKIMIWILMVDKKEEGLQEKLEMNFQQLLHLIGKNNSNIRSNQVDKSVKKIKSKNKRSLIKLLNQDVINRKKRRTKKRTKKRKYRRQKMR